MPSMVFALSTGRFISVAVALLLLLILVLAFVRYSSKARAGDPIRRAAERGGRDAKICPDCAAELPLDTRVCKHCGYEFA